MDGVNLVVIGIFIKQIYGKLEKVDSVEPAVVDSTDEQTARSRSSTDKNKLVIIEK